MGTSRKKEPIRVLQYIGSLNSGGSQSMIMNIYRSIDKKRIQFDFIIDRKDETLYKKEIESLGGKVFVFDEYFKGYNYFGFIKQWKVFFNKNPEYKIVHCHVRSVASIVFRIAKKRGLKTICHSHSTSNGKGLKAIAKKCLQRRIKKNCDYYLACSKESAKWLYGNDILDNHNCMIVNNAIDSSKYVFNEKIRNRVRTVFGFNNKIVLGQVGRIEPVKNHVFSLNLLKELLRDDNRYHLLIVGTGSIKDKLLKRANELGIRGNITILENRNDVFELMQAMDVFIMPSLWEGLPMALVEAQAASLPCIVSNNIRDGILDKELVHREGIDDIKKWKETIINIARNTKVRKNNSDVIVDGGFDIESVANTIENFYYDLAKKKIFFCLGSMGHGGAERVVANLSNYFIEDNVVTIIVTKEWKPEYDLDKDIRHFVLDEKKASRLLLNRTILRVGRLRSILKTESPDIVISFLPEPSFRLMIAKLLLPVKTIISERNDPNTEYDSPIKRLLARLLYAKADGLVFQTPDAKKWFSKKIQNKSVVIPNPIDERFLCAPYTGKREKIIVTVGRLVEQKNQKLLVDAFYEFHKVHKDYCLKIYGDGPLRQDLQKQINEMRLNESTRLMGEVSDVKKEIYKASIFVLASNYEGMPNALMEAMALGIPCVSTDCPIGGPRYLISNNHNGILVKVGDKYGIVTAFDLLATSGNLQKRLSKNALLIRKKVNPKVILGKWSYLISDIVNGLTINDESKGEQ